MNLFPLWRGTIRIPALSTKTKKFGSSILRHTLFQSFETPVEIFDTDIASYKIIKTPCKPPFDEMRLRLKGAKRLPQDQLVLAISGPDNWHKQSHLSLVQLESIESLEQSIMNPEAVCKTWAGDFRFQEHDQDAEIAGLRRPQIGSLHAIAAHFAVGDEFDQATVV